jgi:hypothetical protein
MDQIGQALGDAGPYWDWFYSMLRIGFYEVNNVRGLMIAAVGAYVMANWRKLPLIVLGCGAADLVVRVLGPVVVNNRPVELPAIVEPYFWQSLFALLLGYLVIVTALYLVKLLLLRLFDGRQSHAHEH